MSKGLIQDGNYIHVGMIKNKKLTNNTLQAYFLLSPETSLHFKSPTSDLRKWKRGWEKVLALCLFFLLVYIFIFSSIYPFICFIFLFSFQFFSRLILSSFFMLSFNFILFLPSSLLHSVFFNFFPFFFIFLFSF